MEPLDFIQSIDALLQSQGQKKDLGSIPIAKNPQLLALASKFIKPRPGDVTPADDLQNSQTTNTLIPGVEAIVRRTASRIEDAENTFKLFPDLGLCEAIVVTSVMSPKDMQQSELNFRLENTRFSAAVTSKILEHIRTTMMDTYELRERLPHITRNATFRGGSHPVLVLPEAAVDYIINNSRTLATESVDTSLHRTELFEDTKFESFKPKGFLGEPGKPREGKINAAESFAMPTRAHELLYVDTDNLPTDEFIDVPKLVEFMKDKLRLTDNPDALKLPILKEERKKLRAANAIGGGNVRLYAIESVANRDVKQPITAGRLYSSLYKNANVDYQSFTAIPPMATLTRRSIGRPTVLHVPADCVAPLYSPGDYTKQLGFFLMADMEGAFVSPNDELTGNGDTSGGLASLQAGSSNRNAGIAGLLTEKARANLTSDQYLPMLDRIGDIYAMLLERDWLERASRGLHGNVEMEIGRLNEFSRILIARALKNRYTRVVYVPAEYMTYFAVNYHKNGVGKSYLDDLSNLTSMRAMVLFSRIWAKVRSSIAVTKTNITFDPKDPDPSKTIQTVKHLLGQTRQLYFPNGLRRIEDITTWLHYAGMMITWDNHPRLPNTKIDSESTRVEHVEPDSELDELLRHMQYMHIGLSPETVDAAAKTEFATTVQNNSILFGQRIQLIAKALSIHATDLAQKVYLADATAQKELTEILNTSADEIKNVLTQDELALLEKDKKELTERLIAEIIMSVRATLPEADSTAVKNQAQEMKDYDDFLENSLKYVIDSGVLPQNIAGELSNEISALKDIWKAHLMRDFMSKNNMLPEAFELVATDEDGKPSVVVSEVVKSYSKNLMASSLGILAQMKKYRLAAEKDIADQLGDDAGSSGGSDSGSNDSGSDDSYDASGGDDFSEDDMGMDDGGSPFDEGGGEEEPAPEETPEEEKPTEEPTEPPEA